MSQKLCQQSFEKGEVNTVADNGQTAEIRIQNNPPIFEKLAGWSNFHSAKLKGKDSRVKL